MFTPHHNSSALAGHRHCSPVHRIGPPTGPPRRDGWDRHQDRRDIRGMTTPISATDMMTGATSARHSAICGTSGRGSPGSRFWIPRLRSPG